MPSVFDLSNAGSTLPRFAWDNALDYADTLTATSEASGFPVANLTTWRPFEQWKADSLSATVTATWTTARPISCFAFYGHHIGTVGATVTCEVYNGAWVAFGSAVIPESTEVIYIYGDVVNASQARFTVTGAGDAPEIGVAFIGQDFVPGAGFQPGWAPPAGAQDPDTREAIARNGIWRGATVQDTRAESTATILPIRESDYIANWRPFRDRCNRIQPFFLHWNTTDDVTGAAFCSAATFSAGAYTTPGYQQLTITARMEVR